MHSKMALCQIHESLLEIQDPVSSNKKQQKNKFLNYYQSSTLI